MQAGREAAVAPEGAEVSEAAMGRASADMDLVSEVAMDRALGDPDLVLGDPDLALADRDRASGADTGTAFGGRRHRHRRGVITGEAVLAVPSMHLLRLPWWLCSEFFSFKL